jgi:hypothetical protein
LTVEDKQNYVNDYMKFENIKLDIDSILENPGKRNTSKLKVNSFWGKFAQNPLGYHNTEYISDPQKFFNLLGDETVEVNDAYLISDELLQVQYSKNNRFIQESSHSNVVIAAYVTAHARIELYNLLSQLGPRCLYYDTDSIIFTENEGEFSPKTGIYLGQLTDEVKTKEEPDAYITKFVSCGAKNYSFEVFYPISGRKEYVCKVKGLTLNFQTSAIVNFSTMESLVNEVIEEKEQTKHLIPQMKFVTSKYNDVNTVYNQKIYRLVYDRRMIMRDYTTRPYGYKFSV